MAKSIEFFKQQGIQKNPFLASTGGGAAHHWEMYGEKYYVNFDQRCLTLVTSKKWPQTTQSLGSNLKS